MSTLERAIAIAAAAHAGQLDKAGRPYILHPLRVKLADLRDNSDLSRIAQPAQKDFERLARYRAAIETIQALG